MRTLTLDVGKTGCRAVLEVDGDSVGSAEGDGAPGLAEADGLAGVHAAISTVVDQLSPAGVDLVGAAVAGFQQARDRAEELATRISREHGDAPVTVASDMTASHAGALSGRPGVVVAAGTGAVALAVGPDGSSAQVDGWGWMLGDSGSGYAIGLRGLRAALRAHDGRDGPVALVEPASRRFGDLDALHRTLTDGTSPVRAVASFARDVRELALAGDPWCEQVWADAGHELARSATAAARRVGANTTAIDVTVTGGLAEAGPLLLTPFAEELLRLLPRHRQVPAEGDACTGALLLASRTDLPHEPLVVRHPASATREKNR